MRQVVNFRLSPKTTSMLTTLKDKLHTSKTAIVEEAIDFLYTHKKIQPSHPLLKHAGVLTEADANEMLHAIKTSRKNKQFKVKF